MKICSILDRAWCKECIGLVTVTLHLNHSTPLRTLINVPIVKEILLDCMIVDFDDTDYSLIVSAQEIERYRLMAYLDEVLSFPTLTQKYLSCPDPSQAKVSWSSPNVRKDIRLDTLARQTIGALVSRPITKEELLGMSAPDISEYIDENMLTISDLIEPDGPPTQTAQVDDSDADLPRILGDGPLYDGIRDLCRRYRGIFSRTVRAQPAELPGFVLEVEIDDWTRVASKRGPRKHPPDRAAEIERQVKLMLELGVIQQVHDVAYYSQVLLVPKPGGKWRFCIDFRPLNSVSASNAGHPLPLITQLLRRLGNKRFKNLSKDGLDEWISSDCDGSSDKTLCGVHN